MTLRSLHIPWKDQLQLIRPRLSAMVALATLSGYCASSSKLQWLTLILLFSGIFLLTAAASTFNQLQERERDALLPRTRLRPLASGRLLPQPALVYASLLLLGGCLLLTCVSLKAFLIGLFALGWYNLLYTPLKPHTSLVLLIGALGGALPPLLGWVASGASPLDPKAVNLYLLLILWQIPHFWCLCLRDDLHCQRAGLQLVPKTWSSRLVIRQIRIWSLALATLLLGTLPLDLMRSSTSQLLLVFLALWCAWIVIRGLPSDTKIWAASTGRTLHLVLAGALFLFSIDPLMPF